MSGGLNFHNVPIVIDDNWKRDDTYEGVYPSGARVKDAYFSPEIPENQVIKPNWRYLFKLSSHRYPWQFWCEIIAYRFGCLIGVDVPPAHIGHNKRYGKEGVDTYAALIEWFYDDTKKGYISGGRVMMRFVEGFDPKKGEKHNFKTIRDELDLSGDDNMLKYWAGVLTFDTLIGNLDRHQDNWGIIYERSGKQSAPSVTLHMSPAFDNGTALGHEILEEKMDNFEDTDKAGLLPKT